MKIIDTILFTLATLIIGAGATLLLVGHPSQSLGSNAYQATYFSVASTTNAISVTSSTRILATSSGQRVYAHICNDSATKIYLNMNADKAASVTAGFPLASNACYDINDQNLYTGAIQASSTNQTSATVTVASYEL